MLKKCNIDRVISEPYGKFDKLYNLAENLENVECFVYDKTSFCGLRKEELFNLYKELGYNDVITMEVN